MRILLLQGANMEWLGLRQPELYGTTTAAELDAIMQAEAKRLGVDLEIAYTNVEGAAIDRIYQAARDGVDGLLMNPRASCMAATRSATACAAFGCPMSRSI